MSAFEVDGIAYNITSTMDMTVEVVAKDGGYSGDVAIPEEITYNEKNYTVKGIHNAGYNSLTEGVFFNCTKVTSVSLPNTLTYIGSYAFAYCKGLTSIMIPNNVASIGSGAFVGCDNLTAITIPDCVTNIGGYAFEGCI